MLHGLFIAAVIETCRQGIKEALQPTIPAENWANNDLYYEDIMNGVSVEQRMNNVKNGKYKLTETYPEPHRDPIDGKVVIENCKLYNEDLCKYGAYQTMQWVNQGKYNLNPEELKKEEERIKKKYEYLYSL